MVSMGLQGIDTFKAIFINEAVVDPYVVALKDITANPQKIQFSYSAHVIY
jgi:hypothetical protein